MGRKRKLTVWVVESPKGGGRFKLVWDDPHTGKRRQQKANGTTREACEAEAGELLARIKALADGTTWEGFRARYETDHLPYTAESNAYKWRGMADRLECFAAGRGTAITLLTDITPELLAAFEAELRRTMAAGSLPSHMGTLRAGLSYAAELGLMPPIPKRKKRLRTVTRCKEMHGAPITDRQFAVMLKATAAVAGVSAADWRFLLRLIYWGGLRLSDAFYLHWTDPNCHRPVDLDTAAPKIAFGCMQKNRQDQVVAIAPEAARLLLRQAGGDGWVCQPRGRNGCRFEHLQSVGDVVREIGRAAGVVTDPTGGRKGGPQYAGAHDLRRSFCHRWALRVVPAVLMHMARHRDIKTTLKYYVGSEADGFSAAIAAGYRASRGR